MDRPPDSTSGGRERGLLADHVVEHVRTLILSGRLGPGDRLNEVEIAQALAISRGPVREALRRLASTGLVEASPNLGSRVVALDDARVRSLYEVREALESLAARLAAERMARAARRGLLAMLDEHEAAMAEGAADAYPAGGSDWDFHLAVLRGSENEVAWRVCGNDLRDMFALLRARHGRRPGRGRSALREHRLVAEAVVAGDGDLAALLMARHIRASYRNLLALARGDDGADRGEDET